SAQCVASENGVHWDVSLPTCKGQLTVLCGEPPAVANGSGQSMDRFTQGAIVYYGCKDGFALVGNISINCSEAGQWSRPLPLCKAIGCERPEVRNGKVHKHPSTYEAGEILRFDCDAGHATDGAQEARCQPGGTWDPPVLACEREVMCPRPPNIANGLHSGQSMDRFPQGTTVYYGCKDGFALVGNISINCSEAGQWSRPLPRCQGGSGHPQRCLQEEGRGLSVQDGAQAPMYKGHIHVPAAIGCERPEVRNGKVHGYESTYEAGEILRFDCDAGHATEGPQRAQCQPGGSWDPPVLACERGECGNGQHDGHGKTFFTTGMSVMYSCDPGYYLVGNAQVVCKTLGNWSQPMPRCEGASVWPP
uniref:Sushi domain-containing protein n=1 Tax=Anas platyrhynchos TaxID=8839 RepID=A0A8B9ZG67_ANAPL